MIAGSHPRWVGLLAGLLVTSLAVPQSAHAYIDPLSGSLILQVLAAGILSFVFTMKRSWRWLGARWQSLRGSLRRQ